MKKFLFVLFGVFAIAGAFAAGENIPTSKSYVDSKLAEKQDTIPANDGAARVLTNTGTAGEYGTKGIYDANGAYATQTQNLVDAATMNAGVQNAIDSEFQCIEWVNPDDHTSDCLLMDIRGYAPKRSPNLFDISKVPNTSRIVNNGDGTITVYGNSNSTSVKLFELAPDIVVGDTYTLNFDSTNNFGRYIYLYYHNGTTGLPTSGTVWNIRTSRTITPEMLDGFVYFYSGDNNGHAIISNIQIERGTIATPYQPYGNIYVPSGN